MPEPATLALFVVAAVALIAVPGPNIIYIATRSASEGRRAGLASVLGVETGTIVYTTAAAVGLAALLASSAVAFDIVKYAGAAYLLVLGVRALLAREEGEADPGAHPGPGEPARAGSLARAYRQGVLVQLLNPKVALFFVAFLPQFTDPAQGSVAVQILVLGTVLALLGACISSAYAVAAAAAGSWLRERRRGFGARRYLTGGVYIALGLAAAVGSERRAG